MKRFITPVLLAAVAAAVMAGCHQETVSADSAHATAHTSLARFRVIHGVECISIEPERIASRPVALSCNWDKYNKQGGGQ